MRGAAATLASIRDSEVAPPPPPPPPVDLFAGPYFGTTPGRIGPNGIWLPGVLPGVPLSAPTSAFAVGVEVGVPTGTSLTPTTGLPTEDANETITLTHPVTGATQNLNVKVWRQRSWTARIDPTPGVGEHYLFDKCKWDVTGGGDNFFCINVGETNGVADQMLPLIVFRDCTILGNNDCTGIWGGYVWLERCHVFGMDDGLFRGFWSVVNKCNITAAATGTASHADGMQNSGTGHYTLYNSWFFVGGVSAGINSALRSSVEDGPASNLQVQYCGFSSDPSGGYTVQIVALGVGIDTVEFRGCRWVPASNFGPTDFVDVTNLTWIDNKFTDGTPVPPP